MKINQLTIIILGMLIGCSNHKNEQNQNKTLVEIKLNYDTTKFDFEPDIRLFTLAAFANCSGYDFENANMFPERIDLRNYLDSIVSNDFKDEIKGLNKNSLSKFAEIAFSLSNPPKFNWLPDSLCVSYPNMPHKDSIYLRLLNEFYVEACIPKLWKKYKSTLHDYNYAFVPFTSGISNILNYCRVDSNYFHHTKFILQICPFMKSEFGFTFSSSSKLYIVASPDREAGPEIFYHEPLHHIINPITKKYVKELMKINNATSIGTKVRMKKCGGNYLGIESLTAESLVRTIDYILRAKHYNWTNEKTLEEINIQYATGLTLIPFFYEELKKYEVSELTLNEYFPIMIKKYDLQNEKNRWENFNNSKKY